MITKTNRDGEPNINIGLNFIGPVGTFRELPQAEKMTEGAYEYGAAMGNNLSKYEKVNGVWQQRQE